MNPPRFDRDTVLAALCGRYADFYSSYTPLKLIAGELRGPCPVHGGDGPNFAVDPDKGHWYCHSGCQAGGDVFDLVERLDGLDFPQALERVASWAGLTPNPQVIRPARPAPIAPPSAPVEYLDPCLAETAHARLMEKDGVRTWLADHRGLTTETLRRFWVGLEPPEVKGGEWRVTFPVFDAQGRLTNIRRHLFAYKADLTDERRRELGKTKPWRKGLRADLFPLSAIQDADDVLLVEGEADALLACQMGFAAVSGTLGAGNWKEHWTEALRGKRRVTILYDADGPGQEGARKVAQALSGVVGEVAIGSYPEGIKDLTEWVVGRGAGPADVNLVVQIAVPFAPPAAVSITPPKDDWPVPDPRMFHGLIGEIVWTLDPHTEADPVAVLVQALVAFGSAVGRSAHFVAESDAHHGNLFAVIVGISAKGRKGTSWGHVCRLFESVDLDWVTKCLQSGLSSGEGLIWHVRDPIEKQVKDKKTGEISTVVEDPGIDDKRLLVQESEFASVLRVAGRDGNNLSAILRDAWDRGRLQTMTKNSAARATGAHISLVGHVTADELRRELSTTEAGNGFANRFLWVCVRRSKELPEGGNVNPSDLAPLTLALRLALEDAKTAGRLERDAEARALWYEVYHDLSEGKPGLAGAVTSRGEAQVMRLATLYALLERDTAIRREHLQAALALWHYVEASARYVFGDSLGDSVADDILRALRNAKDGLTRNDLRETFGRHQSSGRIGQALALLHQHGRVRGERQETDGRPAERWFAV